MGKKEKLYARIKNNQKNVRFQEFCALIEYFGFGLVRVRGSHRLYQRADIEEVMNVQPTRNNRAKAYQVRQFLKLVDDHDLRLSDDAEDEPDEQ